MGIMYLFNKLGVYKQHYAQAMDIFKGYKVHSLTLSFHPQNKINVLNHSFYNFWSFGIAMIFLGI